ncbi:survival factor 1 [Coniophora puteana RWD-64-598 SS2]|uniref:Survival factor 1 n=1 Tax=Coniophora puteana (strain RWD-64-598) TaxID=741705 RepID=A0A5M3MYU0_CONPW|nr:survival factor 1 [Coniophora puteana RWD-64-598 SS2]EIW83761.1 survival factor 1 [Coniophora puteana RWD-64-598 SS2]
MSWFFSSVPADAQNFFPVSSAYPESELFSELTPQDTEWTCAGGFVTETQVFYQFLEDGTLIIFQVIHSSVGVWPTIQFTAKIYNPNTKERVWRSSTVRTFTTPPPGLDKRSCKGETADKSEHFSITFRPAYGDKPDTYTINASFGSEVQLSLDIVRPAGVPAFKIGSDKPGDPLARGGFSYFGHDKKEGYVVHRFWPRTYSTGHVIRNGVATEVKGQGIFNHAIQGMRPNLVASRWNFANFQSNEHGGISAVQMEFTTCSTHGFKGANSGAVKVNIGSIVLGDKLALVTAETQVEGQEPAKGNVISRVHHLSPAHDVDTGYGMPSALKYEWAGSSILADASGQVEATLEVQTGAPADPSGLVEKLDVLAEFPSGVKMLVNYVAGTKPYIYQWQNNTKLIVKGPDSIIPGLSQGIEANGILFNEATFIS